MPSDLLKLKCKYVSGSHTGNPGKMQGDNAMLEELNKAQNSG